MTASRYKSACDQCGQYDDHPKVHIGVITKHHDCMSVSEKEMVVGSSETAADIITAAESGTHGDDLLAHIQELHVEPVKGA